MHACYLIMLIMMFIHNMYNAFKISVQFIIKNAFILGTIRFEYHLIGYKNGQH